MSSAVVAQLRQLQEFEEIHREELVWEEERERGLARIAFLKKCKAIHKHIAAEAKKQEVVVVRRHQTFLRRRDNLITEEQRERLHIMQSESLRLEAILRTLEDDIREAIFNDAYDLQQRTKYFNKTVDMIVKSETQERKATVGSERYEWLVMCQRFDNSRLKMLRGEVIQKVCVEKAARHDKTRSERASHTKTQGGQQQRTASASTTFTPNASKASRADGETSDAAAHNTPTSPKGGVPPKKIKPRVETTLSRESREKMLLVIETHEETRRYALEGEEDRAWFTFTRFVDFIHQRDERFASQHDINMDELFKARARRLQLTQKQEFQEREEVMRIEATAFHAIQRKLSRWRYDGDKAVGTEQRRQMGSDQRIAHRYARIQSQKMAFVERERRAINDLLSLTKEEKPVIVQQIVVDPVAVSAEHSRERKQLLKSEEAARKQVVQEEATYAHLLYGEMVAAAGGGDAIAARNKAAQQRREGHERQEYERIAGRLDHAVGKSEAAHKLARKKIELEKTVRTEQQDRVRINQEHVDWHTMMSNNFKIASRLCAFLAGVDGEETRLRGVIQSQERSVREGYFSTFKLGFGPKTRKPPAPLPPPPVDFEKAQQIYASLKGGRRGGASYRASQSNASPKSLNSSMRSNSTTSKSTAPVSAKPPAASRSAKGPTRGHLAAAVSPSKAAQAPPVAVTLNEKHAETKDDYESSQMHTDRDGDSRGPAAHAHVPANEEEQNEEKASDDADKEVSNTKAEAAEKDVKSSPTAAEEAQPAAEHAEQKADHTAESENTNPSANSSRSSSRAQSEPESSRGEQRSTRNDAAETTLKAATQDDEQEM